MANLSEDVGGLALVQGGNAPDPVLAMLGAGQEIWEPESGDRFVERLRSEESRPVPPHTGNSTSSK